MARKKNHEEHGNHEAWAIPYADLMTLLLAFFVVMYAISSRNENKYRSISDALHLAFGGTARSIAPVQLEQGPELVPAPIKSGTPPPSPLRQMRFQTSPAQVRSQYSQEQQRQLHRIADELERALKRLIADKLIIVHRHDWSLDVEINSDILFTTGSAVLDAKARAILHKVARVLSAVDNPIRIEGYTDDRPIHNTQFPSNWELSAARAASVVHLLSEDDIIPGRLSMMGFGEYRPFAENTSEQGRNRNRRVVLVILAGDNDPAASTRLLAAAAVKNTAELPAALDIKPEAAPAASRRAVNTIRHPRTSNSDHMGGTP